MSWMTPVSADMRSLRCLAAMLLLVPEQLLDPAPPPLQPVERKAEVGDRVADRVVRSVVLEPDEQRPLVRPGLEAALPQLGAQQVGAIVDLDKQHLARLGHAGHRVR